MDTVQYIFTVHYHNTAHKPFIPVNCSLFQKKVEKEKEIFGSTDNPWKRLICRIVINTLTQLDFAKEEQLCVFLKPIRLKSARIILKRSLEVELLLEGIKM